METTYIIYKVTNKVDSKVFIGRTKLSLDKVKQHHWRMYNHKIKHDENLSVLYQAFKHYQWDSFEWEVLTTTEDYEQAKKHWKHYVDEYDAYNGYNNRPYFKDGHKQSDEFKQHMSRVMVGKNAMENAHSAKLTEEDVVYIRHIYNAHADITQQALAKEYGITQSAVHHIVTNKTWQYI